MKRSQLALAAALAGVLLIVAAVFVFHDESPQPVAVRMATQSPSPSPTPSPVPEPSPSPDLSPEPSPTPTPGLPSCYKHVGTDASRAEVKNRLAAAARKEYWTTTKGITVPVALMKAIAWQKSRWQSSIVSCDGTTMGIMQVSPKTAAWLNKRFTAEYDLHTLEGNTALGAEYLQWLIKHYGDTTFASARKPYDVLRNPGMLDMVIGAYSAGTSEIDARGAAGIPNPEFVAQVKQFMTTCPCLTY
jgi:hypothetical protein